jgi:predicted DNA-binding protein with PD1-like motif
MRGLRWALVCSLGVFPATGTQAQANKSANSVITVLDSKGQALKAAKLRVASVETGAVEEFRTGERGVASWEAPSGRYEISASVPGLETQTQRIDTTGGRPRALIFKLEAGYVGCEPCQIAESVPLEVITASPPVQVLQEQTISPARAIPAGLAPGMKVRLVSEKGGERVFAVVFSKGDEVLSGLTDFAIQNKIVDAHFTAIGAVSKATLGWLSVPEKQYHAIHVDQQVEVLSMIGDVATFNGKPVVHAHLVLGREDGSTVGGHLWEAFVNPTLEVFVTANSVPLKKVPDETSGMKVIDPAAR